MRYEKGVDRGRKVEICSIEKMAVLISRFFYSS